MGEVGCYSGTIKLRGRSLMMPDLLEDLVAFAYATQSTRGENVCSVCGNDLEENEDGEIYCPQCDE